MSSSLIAGRRDFDVAVQVASLLKFRRQNACYGFCVPLSRENHEVNRFNICNVNMMNQGGEDNVSSSIQIERAESGWVLTAQQFFDSPVADVFEYFGDAGNLEEITPPWLHFKVLTPQPIVMQVGTLIDYKLRLHLMPIRWKTEICVWEPPHRFIDRQLRGPYRKWIHEHTFKEQTGGTLMTDRVEYDVLGGSLIHSLLVRRDLLKIFEYRRNVMKKHFGH